MFNFLFSIFNRKPRRYPELLAVVTLGEVSINIEPSDTVFRIMYRPSFLTYQNQTFSFIIEPGPSLGDMFKLRSFSWNGRDYKPSDFKKWEWTYFKNQLTEQKFNWIDTYLQTKKQIAIENRLLH